MSDGTEFFYVKSKFNELTQSEREAFLKWGNYTLQQNQNDINNTDNNNALTILDESNKPFSKKGLKRVIKRYFYSINRPQIKKHSKKRKRERKLLQKQTHLDEQKYSHNTNNNKHCDDAPPSKKQKYRHLRSKNLRDFVQDKLNKNPNAPHIVLDCRFDHLMDHQQVVSVAAQIRQLYGLNMKAPIPCNLYATSFTGRLKAQFRERHSENNYGYHVLNVWRMNFIQDSMEKYFENEIESKEKEFIYLTAESDNEIECIEQNKIYVIGAFVDKNKYKGYTYNLAQNNKWKHAKLPILKYMKVDENDENAFQTRLVITINQVYAILCALYNWNDWRKALQFAFPTRKGFVLKEPLSECEMKSLVFDGHKIPIESNKYRKGVLNDNENENDESNQDFDL